MKNKSFETVDVNMTDETFLKIAKEAHSHDITFNEMCCRILEETIKEVTKERVQKSAPMKAISSSILYNLGR